MTAEVIGTIRQLGYLTDDLDRAVSEWRTKLRIGPWTIIRNIPLPGTYLGEPTEPRIDAAFSYSGDLQLELIQQVNGDTSPYQPFIEQRQYGLHHTGYLCEQIDAGIEHLQQQGMKLAFDIRMPGSGRYVYFQSPIPGEKNFIELIEATASIKQMFDEGIPAAAAWDGTGEPYSLDFSDMGMASD